jgi:hypothetical protein
VVYLQSEIKRGFLRQIVEGSKKAGCTLRNSLLAFQAAIYTPNFQRGRILISTSGSGQSGSFEIGVSGKQFTQENVFALSEEFLATLDAIIADGAVDGTTAEALDALFTTMSDSMRGVRSQMGDFSCLNV